MKQLYLFVCILLISSLKAQSYQSQNISFVSLIAPNNSTVVSPVGNKYSGCWGWYQASKNKEYGICGASNGTYFIDISNPATPSVSAFVPGRPGSTWREMKTYRNYCYIACDDAKPNVFQIVDMQYLPDSVVVVHNGAGYIERGHTLWVDSNRLYVGGPSYATGSSPMAIFSLATPTAPVLLKKLEDDIGSSLINYVHDMYVRNDTIYASAAYQGLFVLKYDQTLDTLTILGSYSHGGAYNHSSFLTQNGKYLMFCDEVPNSLPIRMVDVQNLSNIQPLQTFWPSPKTTPHNPYLIGNQFAVVSCYQDGLYIFDISQPNNIKQTGFFDTYPQGGVNNGTYTPGAYAGNWGAYPYLPSGLIVANDMQNGMFVLNPSMAYTASGSPVNAVGLKDPTINSKPYLSVYPNPTNNWFTLKVNSSLNNLIQIHNAAGVIVYSKSCGPVFSEELNTNNFEPGLYMVTVINDLGISTKKLQIIH